jgi:23S rRNA pseudouridine2605 synthase
MIHDPQRSDGAGQGQGRAAEGDRVAKALARAGVASRREVERLIEAGRVALNGRVLTSPAVKVEAGDILTVDGEVVEDAEPARLFRYHKPAGLVTSHKDPQGRPTVFERLPEGLPRLISVGRLDLNSEGLLLLTNDGALARALELPATGVVRRYRARAHGRITQERLDRLQAGVTVEGVRYGPIEARLDKAKEGPQGANVWLTVTLSEGKNREVRRVLESVGLKVNRLIRLSYGPLALGTLGVGDIEEVGPRVVREQFGAHIAPANLPKGDRPQFVSTGASSRRPNAEPRAAGGGGERMAPKEPAPKKTYKAGWAKAKPPKPGGIRGPKAASKAGAAARRPGPKTETGKPGGTGPQARPQQAKRPGAKPQGAKFQKTRPRGSKPSGPGAR